MKTHVLLIGAGHAHAQVLQAWARQPLAGVKLTVVAPQAMAPYSGMVPGWLAGHYPFADITIDMAALCRRAGAQWHAGELAELEPAQGRVVLTHGTALFYDTLSLNVGATLALPPASNTPRFLPLRPLADLPGRYQHLLADWCRPGASSPLHIGAAGGGAAGFEAILAVLHRLRQLRPTRPVHATLWTGSAGLLAGYPPRVQRTANQALATAGVTVHHGQAWQATATPTVDYLLLATGAQAHAWQRDPQRRGNLAVSPQGFIRVDNQLASVSHDNIFAVGDCADWEPPLPKAGVHAVRMGPVLCHNLQARLTGTALQPYQPQSRFLSLLATADGRAIASRGRWSAAGRWAWHWKDHIDRAFVRQFTAGDA